MTVITRITTQKKHRGRFNVYIDRGQGEEFGFGVSEDVLVAFALSKGKEIDEDELKGIIFEDEIKTAFNLAVNFLSYRMRSEKEMQDYLRKKEIRSDVIDQVIERLKQQHYIDDIEFAKAFVESRKRMSSKGPAVIFQELHKKGVPESDIMKALEGFSFEEQVTTAARFAEKQAKRHRNKSTREMQQAIMQTLMGKGFDRDVIETAVHQITLEKDEDDEWQALVVQAEKAHRKYKKYEKPEYEQRMKKHLYRKGFPFAMIERYLEGRE